MLILSVGGILFRFTVIVILSFKKRQFSRNWFDEVACLSLFGDLWEKFLVGSQKRADKTIHPSIDIMTAAYREKIVPAQSSKDIAFPLPSQNQILRVNIKLELGEMTWEDFIVGKMLGKVYILVFF